MGNSKAIDHLPEFIAKMEAEGLSPLVCETFAYYYKQVLTGETGMIFDRDIQPVAPDEIEDLANLTEYSAAGNRLLLSGMDKQEVKILTLSMLYELDYRGSPFKGPIDAQVTIAAFDDFQ